MKKKALFFCLLTTLVLLCACGRNDLLKRAGNNVNIYRWDGEKTVNYWTYGSEKGRPVVRSLKKVRARKAPTGRPNRRSCPCTAFRWTQPTAQA